MRKPEQRIQTFRTFESVTQGLTPEQKSWLNECTEGRGTWTVNAEGLVDVRGGFSCAYQLLSDFKGVRFGKVSESFNCSYNKLTSLEGAPREVSKTFHCSRNSLTSLEGAPLEVDGHFYCDNNKLTSLVEAPQEVKGIFECERNPLQTLLGAPQKIGGHFRFSAGIEAPQFYISQGQWGPAGWAKSLKTIDDPKARDLVLTLLDPKPLLAKLKGDPKQDGQVLLELSYFWGIPGSESIQKELEASLTPVQIKSIQALRRMHGYL